MQDNPPPALLLLPLLSCHYDEDLDAQTSPLLSALNGSRGHIGCKVVIVVIVVVVVVVALSSEAAKAGGAMGGWSRDHTAAVENNCRTTFLLLCCCLPLLSCRYDEDLDAQTPPLLSALKFTMMLLVELRQASNAAVAGAATNTTCDGDAGR